MLYTVSARRKEKRLPPWFQQAPAMCVKGLRFLLSPKKKNHPKPRSLKTIFDYGNPLYFEIRKFLILQLCNYLWDKPSRDTHNSANLITFALYAEKYLHSRFKINDSTPIINDRYHTDCEIGAQVRRTNANKLIQKIDITMRYQTR